MQTPVCTTRPFLKAVTTPTNDRPLRSRALPVHPWRHLQKVVVEVVTASGNGDIPTQKRVSASVYIALSARARMSVLRRSIRRKPPFQAQYRPFHAWTMKTTVRSINNTNGRACLLVTKKW